MAGVDPTSNAPPLVIRSLLDDALAGLCALEEPPHPVRALEKHVSSALAHLHDALAASGDPAAFHASWQATQKFAQDAHELLRPHAGLGTVDSELALLSKAVQALQRPAVSWGAPSTSLKGAAPKPLPRASVNEPRLLELDRAVIPPVVVLPPSNDTPKIEASPAAESPELREPVDLDALLAQASSEAEAAEALPPASTETEEAPAPVEEKPAEYSFGAQQTRDAVVFERARSFFEDLGMMSLMRQPNADEYWRDLRPVEERLLARLDGIFACGEPVLPRLVKLLEEQPVPDPEMTWAALFLYGSLAGDDTLEQVALLTRTTDLEPPEMRAAVGDALSFAPHPGIDELLRPLLSHPVATMRALALHALARRGKLTAEEAVAAARDPDQEVVVGAAQAMSLVLGKVKESELIPLLRHANPDVARAAMEAALRHRSHLGARQAADLVASGRADFGDAALYLAIASDAESLPLLREAARKGSPCAVDALGWFGHLDAVATLIAMLEKDDTRTVGALQRLTGASLTDDSADPEYDEGKEPFGPDFPWPAHVGELTAKAEIWAAWWNKHKARANLKLRYRFGHRWSPKDNLWELTDAHALPRERALAHLELVVRTGGALPFDARDFIARQEQQLDAWRSFLATRRGPTGTWPSMLSH
jgi:hypothetical protein